MRPLSSEKDALHITLCYLPLVFSEEDNRKWNQWHFKCCQWQRERERRIWWW